MHLFYYLKRMQMDEMKANTVELCEIHPGNTSGSIEMMCGEVFQKIGKLTFRLQI